MTMVEAIKEICGDDQPLYEAILDLYKQVPDRTTYASVGARLWRCIQSLRDGHQLGVILAQKGMMVPKGIVMRVAGAIFRIYAGNASARRIVSFKPSVGESVPDRIFINIAPWVSQYYQTHEVTFEEDYNDIAYDILLAHKDELVSLIDDTLTSQAEQQDFVDLSIDKLREMNTTQADI